MSLLIILLFVHAMNIQYLSEFNINGQPILRSVAKLRVLNWVSVDLNIGEISSLAPLKTLCDNEIYLSLVATFYNFIYIIYEHLLLPQKDQKILPFLKPIPHKHKLKTLV